ncbi:MAG: hypothetical protein WKI04_10815 [Ferruginibacter sp.]
MNEEGKKKEIEPKDLPQAEVFIKKEIFQHPQPASQGLPLNTVDNKEGGGKIDDKKEQDKSSKESGLNEENSAGTAGAFEGFEDQGTN